MSNLPISVYIRPSVCSFSSDKEQKVAGSAWYEEHSSGWRSSNPFPVVWNNVRLNSFLKAEFYSALVRTLLKKCSDDQKNESWILLHFNTDLFDKETLSNFFYRAIVLG